MKTIYKYKLDAMGSLDNVVYQDVAMPAGASIIRVALQGETTCIWAICEIDALLNIKERRIRLTGTGHPVPEDGAYIGTVDIDGYVWHYFDMGEQ